MAHDTHSKQAEDERFGRRIRDGIDAACMCYGAGRYAEAASILDDILPSIVSCGAMPDLWSMYGESLFHTGRRDEAARALQRAVQLDPARGRDWRSLGGILRSLDRLSEARDAMLHATQLLPDDAETWSNFGVVLRALDDPERAMTCYQRAIATDPGFVLSWRNLGNLHRDAERWDDAINCYERVLELRSGQARDWNDLGVAYAGAQRKADARGAWEETLRLDPTDVDATCNLTMWHLQNGSEPRRVRAWYRRLKQISAASAREVMEKVARVMGTSIEDAERHF
jgi:Flp pilus assembly protein TadD